LIKKFEAGYYWGAKQANPGIVILDPVYLTQLPDFGGFTDPAKGKEAALALYSQGADIIYAAAGLSGQGMFEAAKEDSESSGTKVWGIGVDSDQYNTVGEDLQEYVMTSMLKRVGVAVYAACTAHIADEQLSAVLLFDLAADGVGYSTTGGFVDDIADPIDELRVAIIAGDLVVPTEPEA